MVYLIIAIVLLVIIAPIIHVLPSKEQKLRMAKRREAMGQGISVEMVTIEDPDPDPKKHRSGSGRAMPRDLSLVAYRVHRSRGVNQIDRLRWKLFRFDGKGRIPFTDGWWWADAENQLQIGELHDHLSAHVGKLPPSVLAIEEKNQFISIYWHEQGEVSEVIDFLERTLAI